MQLCLGKVPYDQPHALVTRVAIRLSHLSLAPRSLFVAPGSFIFLTRCSPHAPVQYRETRPRASSFWAISFNVRDVLALAPGVDVASWPQKWPRFNPLKGFISPSYSIGPGISNGPWHSSVSRQLWNSFMGTHSPRPPPSTISIFLETHRGRFGISLVSAPMSLISPICLIGEKLDENIDEHRTKIYTHQGSVHD